MQSRKTCSNALAFNILFLLINILNINCKRLDDGYYDISTYTNCNGLDDGYYDIEVIANLTINILCSNEYMIIDILHDNQWLNLLSSYKDYDKHIIGPLTNDHVNWDSFIPSTDIQIDHYLVSPDCESCDLNSYLNAGLYGDHSAYYMNQIASGCFHKNRGLPACDMDPVTYQCKICQWSEGTVLSRPYSTANDYTDDENTGICAFSIKPSNFIVATQFSQCLNYETSAFKPSLGSNGAYCQCIKPDASNGYESRQSKALLLANVNTNDIVRSPQTHIQIEADITYLYQRDFAVGTYRILQGGTYVVMEDILFDFNANVHAPNAVGAYMPHCDQMDIYPGACSQFGPYFLGFFSGITIETTEGVILDLNDHSIGMSVEFFYQQGFFSIIELGSQPFLPMHGPGNFGANAVYAENVIIKNGVLLRSSHHGIHGNNNKNIEINNVMVKQFVTHGIQLNGFSDITLKNIDIGPTNDIIKLNANYIQMRALLNNLRTLYAKNSVKHKQFSFSGRKHDVMTLEELVEDRLIAAMDEAFRFAVNENYKIKDNDIKAIVDNVFVNDASHNIPYGAVVYGVFLNYPASGIFGWHVSEEQSVGALIENVNVHDLYHHSEELIGLTTNKHGISNAFNGPLSAISLVGTQRMQEIANVIETKSGEFHANYVGDITTDVHFAYYLLGYDDWDLFPGTPYYGDNSELAKWAFGDDPYYENVISSDRITTQQELNELVTCNGDRMQHPLKGIVGIKITGVSNVQFKGSLTVNNLYDSTPLGSTLCGPYTKANFGQQLPYSFGFSGNMIHGMDVTFSDITFDLHQFRISNLISETGLSYGLSTWYNTQIQFNQDTDFSITNIKAGNKYLDEIPSDNAMRFVAPNHKPQACGIRIHENKVYPVTISFGSDESLFKQQCIIGITGCEEDTQKTKFPFTHLGNVNNMECQDLRAPINMNKNNDGGEGQNIFGEKEEIIEKVQYFGNVFLMTAILVIVFSVLAVYYWCCFIDKKEDGIGQYSSYYAYGSL